MSGAGALKFSELRGEPDTRIETLLGGHSTGLVDQALPLGFPYVGFFPHQRIIAIVGQIVNPMEFVLEVVAGAYATDLKRGSSRLPS